jgi:hypothetical protein
VQKISIVVFIGIAKLIWGQESAGTNPTGTKLPGIEVTREPPNAFATGVPATLPGDNQSNDPAAVPKDYRPRLDVPLSASARSCSSQRKMARRDEYSCRW